MAALGARDISRANVLGLKEDLMEDEVVELGVLNVAFPEDVDHPLGNLELPVVQDQNF